VLVVPQGRVVAVGAGMVRLQDEQMLLMVLAKPLDDVRVGFEAGGHLGHRGTPTPPNPGSARNERLKLPASWAATTAASELPAPATLAD
jgi:hypothetical protein